MRTHMFPHTQAHTYVCISDSDFEELAVAGDFNLGGGRTPPNQNEHTHLKIILPYVGIINMN